MKRMTRTRIVFFSVIGLIVLILMISLATQAIDTRLLSQLFIAATIFSVGVVAVDMLGLLGGDGGEAAEAGGDSGGDSGEFGELGEAGDVSDGGEAAGVDNGEVDWAPDSGEEFGPGDTHTGHLGDQGSPVLSALTYLRMFVYFCLGFGPVGWFAMAGGRNPAIALLLAAAVGSLAVFIAQAFFRFQRSDTDSTVRSNELLRQQATVLVGLSDTTLGRVRVQLGMSILEPYARAAHEGASFQKGDTVRIVQVTDDCVYVE